MSNRLLLVAGGIVVARGRREGVILTQGPLARMQGLALTVLDRLSGPRDRMLGPEIVLESGNVTLTVPR